MDISDKQWEVLEKPLTSIFHKSETRGRPRQDPRAVLNGILWICRTGAPWADLPGRYPPYQTCHRYHKHWCKSGSWDKLLHALASDLRDRGKIDITECFIDGTFASAKKGACVGPTKKGKGTKIMAVTDAVGIPLTVRAFSASTHEVKLADRTIRSCAIKPKRVIADRAYDSDKLRRTLKKRGIQLVCPHRSNRKRQVHQDGRELRRYKRRWKVERLFAWLFNSRRTFVRYEYHADLFLGMVQLACVMIILKSYF
ncbi:MAG: IS5 family transposase [Flavobacteriales bacterium]|nr:IS5 family transposase [Flavobacteriales bacterium]MBK9537054.1 IS5 family transposase [Flavobacteriales bacterium]